MRFAFGVWRLACEALSSVGLSFSSASCAWQPHGVALRHDPSDNATWLTEGRITIHRDFRADCVSKLAKRQTPNGGPLTVDRRRETTALKAPLHICDDIIAELGAFDLGRALHQAGEIIGDPLAGNRFVQTVDYEVCRFFPA